MKKRQVFNLGFSKTGTSSIEVALGSLGYRVARGHWQLHYLGFLEVLCINRDYEEILEFTRSYDAFCDAPWGGGTDLYKYLAEHLPDARFLLSIRAPDAWHRSFETMLTTIDRNLDTALSSYADAGFWASVYWFRRIFDIRQLAGQKEKIIACYNEYNQRVIAHFAELRRPLLVLDLSEGNGWKPLCDYLEEPVPNQPFPYVNVAPTGWTDTKLSLHQNMQQRLQPAPAPLAPSLAARAGALFSEGRAVEAAPLFEELHRTCPDDADIALMTSFAAFAAGRGDIGARTFEVAIRKIDGNLVCNGATLDTILQALTEATANSRVLAAVGVAWLIYRRGAEIMLGSETTFARIQKLAVDLHSVDYLASLNLPARIGARETPPA